MQDALGVDAFARSEEALAAEAVFEAYRLGSREDIQQCVKKHSIFADLDNQVFCFSYIHSSLRVVFLQTGISLMCLHILKDEACKGHTEQSLYPEDRTSTFSSS